MVTKEFREALALLQKIMEFRDEYFSNDCLNSEGRKVLERAFMFILNADPVLKKKINRIRRKPCYENISKFYEELKIRLFEN